MRHSQFFPHDIPFPAITTDDYLKQAAEDIITILTAPPSPTTPSLSAGDPVRNALLEIATQLKRIEAIPQTLNTTTVPNTTNALDTTILASSPRVPLPPSTTTPAPRCGVLHQHRHQQQSTLTLLLNHTIAIRR